ncbi:PIG-L family deacetylase [Clostridium culturomicium]|uniref:PIG-L family deacetylase n=1 Tax=Clostridium culturomicium TaxID=1499683 RepID=UPI0038578AE4
MSKVSINAKSFTTKRHKSILIKILISIVILILLALLPIPILYTYNYGDSFSNSFFSSPTFSNKRVMVIAPHQDDEINIAGSTINNFVQNGSEVIVVFTTNGDYYDKGAIRINEAVNAMKSLGVEEYNIVFLGYGDQWDTDYKHIYNAPENEIIKSNIGNTETYGIKEKEDFRRTISNTSSEYTRDNYKLDVKDVILKYLPEMIFSVDFDSHVDHRATSLIFEEAMGEILKENEEYAPNVFKGFAYNTAWNAKDDFYSYNLESTLLPAREAIDNVTYELDIPNYNWEDRVRFPVNKNMLGYTKRSNLLYEALKEHDSQLAYTRMVNIANSDQVFWKRNTGSIAYDGLIEVSSGEAKYLTDFKLIDSSDITIRKPSIFDQCVWIPETEDGEKTVRVIFNKPSDIYSLSLYDNFSLEDNIIKGKITFSDGSEVIVEKINKNGSETKVKFPVKNDIEYVEFQIIEFEGDEPGLCELEVFNQVDALDTQYIKLMMDNESETFIYRYTVLDESYIPLNVYSYPNIDDKLTLEDCKVSIINGKDVFKFENNKLVITERKSGKYKIRVELIDNPEVYDEVEIFIPTKIEAMYIKVMQIYEQLLDRGVLSFKYRMGLID